MKPANPYDWQRHDPKVQVSRSALPEVVDCLRRGGGAVVLGGRGMGKSVFLQQVKAELEQSPEVRVILFASPPTDLTVGTCLKALARELEVPVEDALDPRDLLEQYLSRDGAPLHLVLLYDELDAYGRAPGDPPGRRFFNGLEAARREIPRIAVLAAGSLGVFVFRDVLGSSFLSRAARFLLSPFERSELHSLSSPFSVLEEALSEEVLDALQLASGGHPALTTYGLQRLWEASSLSVWSVTDAFIRFREIHREFLRDLSLSFSDPGLSEAPQRVWDLVQAKSGAVSRTELQAACGSPSGPLRLDFMDVLDLLQATGLVRVTGSPVSDDPVSAWPIPSILSLPRTGSPVSSLRERLSRDLADVLAWLHAVGADFFRSGTQEKVLVPEAVFSGSLSMVLRARGWEVEREAESAAGRTDLKVWRQGSGDRGVVEVKIWGRNDYRDVHHQLESYWTAGVLAGAVVMLTDAEIGDWPEIYRRECLGSGALEVELVSRPESPVRACFVCRSTTADGFAATIEHFLLRIPRRL